MNHAEAPKTSERKSKYFEKILGVGREQKKVWGPRRVDSMGGPARTWWIHGQSE